MGTLLREAQRPPGFEEAEPMGQGRVDGYLSQDPRAPAAEAPLGRLWARVTGRGPWSQERPVSPFLRVVSSLPPRPRALGGPGAWLGGSHRSLGGPRCRHWGWEIDGSENRVAEVGLSVGDSSGWQCQGSLAGSLTGAPQFGLRCGQDFAHGWPAPPSLEAMVESSQLCRGPPP